MRRIFFRYLNFFARFWIAAGARWVAFLTETSKTADLNAPSLRQRVGYCAQQDFNRTIRVLQRELRKLVSEQCSQFGWVHRNQKTNRARRKTSAIRLSAFFRAFFSEIAQGVEREDSMNNTASASDAVQAAEKCSSLFYPILPSVVHQDSLCRLRSSARLLVVGLHPVDLKASLSL